MFFTLSVIAVVSSMKTDNLGKYCISEMLRGKKLQELFHEDIPY